MEHCVQESVSFLLTGVAGRSPSILHKVAGNESIPVTQKTLSEKCVRRRKKNLKSLFFSHNPTLSYCDLRKSKVAMRAARGICWLPGSHETELEVAMKGPWCPFLGGWVATEVIRAFQTRLPAVLTPERSFSPYWTFDLVSRGIRALSHSHSLLPIFRCVWDVAHESSLCGILGSFTSH